MYFHVTFFFSPKETAEKKFGSTAKHGNCKNLSEKDDKCPLPVTSRSAAWLGSGRNWAGRKRNMGVSG